jgi:hypothetical protein
MGDEDPQDVEDAANDYAELKLKAYGNTQLLQNAWTRNLEVKTFKLNNSHPNKKKKKKKNMFSVPCCTLRW